VYVYARRSRSSATATRARARSNNVQLMWWEQKSGARARGARWEVRDGGGQHNVHVGVASRTCVRVCACAGAADDFLYLHNYLHVASTNMHMHTPPACSLTRTATDGATARNTHHEEDYSTTINILKDCSTTAYYRGQRQPPKMPQTEPRQLVRPAMPLRQHPKAAPPPLF